MNQLITPEILNTGIKVLGLTVVTKTLEGPIQTINDIWGMLGGDWLHTKRLAQQQKYAENITKKIVNIPEENLQEPQLSILGPALEASKYYIEDEEIQDLFSNLISSSMDKTYNGIVQHSFVEIIKQLTPYDAKLFKSLNKYEPIVSLIDSIDKTSHTTFVDKFFVNTEFSDYKSNEISIENLIRLGLLKIPEDSYFTNSSLYDRYSTYGDINHTNLDAPINSRICHKKQLIMTSFGEAFKKVCVKN